jgi:uncharacterized protein YbjT (DUF2867 family)
MSRTILVIGATGKTGRRLVPMLQAQGANVRAASRSPQDGMTIFNWQNEITHRDALNGVDSIYLIPPELLENAVPVVEPFLAMATGAGVQRIVLLSSMGAAFPAEPATSGRLALETLVQGCSLEWTILRPSGFMQNFSEGFLLPAVRNGLLPNPAGDGRAGMVDVGDIALVAAAVLACGDASHSGHIYDVTGPKLISCADAAAIIARVAGRPVIARPMSPPQFLAMLESVGVPHDYAAMLVRDQEAIREGAAAVVTDTVGRIGGRDPIDFQRYAANAASAWKL